MADDCEAPVAVDLPVPVDVARLPSRTDLFAVCADVAGAVV